jgi:hypothetical protein
VAAEGATAVIAEEEVDSEETEVVAVEAEGAFNQIMDLQPP